MTACIDSRDAAMQVIGWTIGAIIVGAVLYPLLVMARERKWCRFVGISPHEYKVNYEKISLIYVDCTRRCCIR